MSTGFNSPLRSAAFANDLTAFKAELRVLEEQQMLPHDTNPIIAEIVRRDNGEMMKALLASAAKIDAQVRAKNEADLSNQEAIGQVRVSDRGSEDAKERYRPLNFRMCLDHAGIGDGQHALKPSVIFELTQSPQFAQAIKDNDSTVSTAIANLMTRNGDQTRRLTPILQQIDDVAPENAAAIARQAMIGSLMDDKHNCFTQGTRESFTLIEERLDQEGVDAVAHALARQQSGKGEEYQAREQMIFQRASKEVLREAQKYIAASGSAATLSTLSDRLGIDADPKEGLLAACGPNLSGESTAQANARSLENLNAMLDTNPDYNRDDIFAAMEAAIENRKDKHLGALLDYARDKFPDLAAQPTADDSSLLIKALSVKSGKTYDSGDNSVVERMAMMLLRLDGVAAPDANGNHPLSILAERGMENSGTYRLVDKVLGKEVDVQYAGKIAAAELKAKLELVGRMQEMGLDQTTILALLGGAPAAAAAPAKALPPAIGGHTARITRKDAIPGDDTIPGG